MKKLIAVVAVLAVVAVGSTAMAVEYHWTQWVISDGFTGDYRGEINTTNEGTMFSLKGKAAGRSAWATMVTHGEVETVFDAGSFVVYTGDYPMDDNSWGLVMSPYYVDEVTGWHFPKVGIGVARPTEKLDVDGKVKATGFIGDGSQLTGIVHAPNAADVVGLQAEINALLPITIADVTLLQDALNAKGNKVHTHAIADVDTLARRLWNLDNDLGLLENDMLTHTHRYLSGWGAGQNNTPLDTGDSQRSAPEGPRRN